MFVSRAKKKKEPRGRNVLSAAFSAKDHVIISHLLNHLLYIFDALQ